MTFDTPKISQLIGLKSEILLGIPEKRLYIPPLGVCLDDSGPLPPNLVGGEVSRGARKLLIVVADKDSYLTDPFEVHRFGEELIDPIPYLNLPECFSRERFGKIADWHVSPLDLDGAVRLESGNPVQALALEKFDEILGSKPAVEQGTLNFESALESIFHQFLSQLNFGLERDTLFSAQILLEVQPKVERMALPVSIDELHCDDVVSQDVSFLAVVPSKSRPLLSFSRSCG